MPIPNTQSADVANNAATAASFNPEPSTLDPSKGKNDEKPRVDTLMMKEKGFNGK
jgi:hypothetical protein